MKKTLIPLLLALSLAGCATPPTQEEAMAADYGAYPDNYEGVIKNYMQTILKDPESAQYHFLNTPSKGWSTLGGKKYGYRVCVSINAKNSFGGYIGNLTNYFMIKDGQVIDSDISSGGDYGSLMADAKCKNVN